MPTDASIGRQKLTEFLRIESSLERLTGQGFSLPRFDRHGGDLLVIKQLRAIADCLETITTPPEPETTPVIQTGTVEAVTSMVEDDLTEAGSDGDPESAQEPEEAAEMDYTALNVPQLKKVAKERGLLSAELNTKVLLIEALEAADRAAEQVNANE